MAVHVTVQDNPLFDLADMDQHLGGEDLRVEEWTRLDPSPVQVHAQETAPIVAVLHSIRIQHRHHPEDEVSPELLHLLALAHQILQHPLHHITRNTLTRMHPRRQHHHPFMRMVLLKRSLPAVTHGSHDLVQGTLIGVTGVEGEELQILAVAEVAVHVVCDGEQVHWVPS